MNSMASSVAPGAPHPRFRVLRALASVLLWIILGILTLWALAALYVDVRIAWLRIPAVFLYVVALIAIFWKVKAQRYRAALCLVAFCVVTAWWFSLKPTNVSDWEENVSRTASIEVKGDQVTIHNLRNCDYRTETDYSNCWSDRTVYLSQLRGVDLFFTTWGPKYIGHPILSFQFGDHDHICFSIEARYKLGQGYSAILGFFRQYELIFVTADERDVIRLRTNFRKDEGYACIAPRYHRRQREPSSSFTPTILTSSRIIPSGTTPSPRIALPRWIASLPPISPIHSRGTIRFF